jgi:RNA polymerase sigma-70 factor (ECF subfamily)
MMDTREEGLLKKAKRGDKEAIASLYDAHYGAVYNYIHYRVEDQPTAEDLTAEVFIRMLQKLTGYVNRGRPLLAWLYTIARNLVIDHHRNLNKGEELPIVDHLLEDGEGDPLQEVQAYQTQDCFKRALTQLPETQRSILIYRFVDEFSTSQILELMDKSDPAVRSLQHRALRSLERALKEENCL